MPGAGVGKSPGEIDKRMLRESQQHRVQSVTHPNTGYPCQTVTSAIRRESLLSFSWIDRIIFKLNVVHCGVCYSSCCFVCFCIFRFWVKTITIKRLVGPSKKIFYSQPYYHSAIQNNNFARWTSSDLANFSHIFPWSVDHNKASIDAT